MFTVLFVLFSPGKNYSYKLIILNLTKLKGKALYCLGLKDHSYQKEVLPIQGVMNVTMDW